MGYFGEHPGMIELECDEHGKFLIHVRTPDGTIFSELRCPRCKQIEEDESAKGEK